MPTYSNDGLKRLQVVNSLGKTVIVEPTASVQTFLILDKIFPNVSKTSDEPFLNSVMRFVELSFTDAELKTIVLRSDEILEGRQIIIYGGGATFLAEVRLNHVNAPIRRKIDVARGIMGTTIQLARQIETVKISSLTTGTIQAYIER